MHWQAGQFVVLESPGVKGFRAYSMVNFDENGYRPRWSWWSNAFPGGKFSDWLFDGLKSGRRRCRIRASRYAAVFEPELNKDIMCIAGGSGIAGMMSILIAR